MAAFNLLVLLAFSAIVPSSAADVSPVQKVITMLGEMVAKAKKEKQDEQDQFAEFQRFCITTSQEKKKAIAKGEALINKLEADIVKAEDEVAVCQKAVAAHESDISKWEAEKSAATAARKKEHADYEVEYQDYGDSIDAVQRAQAQLEAGSAVSLVEQKAVLGRLADLKRGLPSAQRALQSFLQQGDSDLPEGAEDLPAPEVLHHAGAPEAKTYESHSGGVMDIVNDMGENFENKRRQIEKEEMQKSFSFDQIAQDLTTSIKNAERQLSEKASQAQEHQTAAGQYKYELGQTKSDVVADSTFLADVEAECAAKSPDYEKRQQLRAGEIVALQKAIEIMSSTAIADGAQHLPSLAQTSLLQLRSDAVSPMQRNVAAFLAETAQRSGSRLLEAIAARVKEDPFKKVTKMIEDMVTKLLNEGQEETEHKAFCDEEMATNKNTRDMKSEEVEELTAKADKLAADIVKYGKEIAELSDEITVIDAEVKKASAERTAEKEKNQATMVDAKGGLAATNKAIEVLRDFYASAAEATALAQYRSGARVPGAPATFDKPYTGQGGEGGIIGMLEVCASDFTRLDAETMASETEAAKSYNEFMRDASKEKAVKTTDMKARSDSKLEAESTLLETKKDLKSTKEELADAMQYFDKLKPSCVESGVSYEERVAKRKEEIESLKEALEILNQQKA